MELLGITHWAETGGEENRSKIALYETELGNRGVDGVAALPAAKQLHDMPALRELTLDLGGTLPWGTELDNRGVEHFRTHSNQSHYGGLQQYLRAVEGQQCLGQEDALLHTLSLVSHLRRNIISEKHSPIAAESQKT